MKTGVFLLALLGLVACGVDGEPVQPTGGVAVTLSPGNSSVGGSVGVRRGPFTLGLGF